MPPYTPLQLFGACLGLAGLLVLAGVGVLEALNYKAYR